MEWLIIFLYSIVAYGISNMFVYAMGPFHIFKGIRTLARKIHPQLGELFDCMICFPTWVGLILSALNAYFIPEKGFTPFNIVGGMPWWAIIIFDAAYTSGIVWLINTVQEALERTEDE